MRKSANLPMIFFAGGSGLSSPRSMILDLLAEGCNLPFTLINGQRNLSELYYHAEFEALAREHGNFRLDAGAAVRARHLHREIRFRS